MRHIIMCPARVLPCSQPVSHGRGLRCCAAGVTGGFAGGERGVQQYVEEGDIKLAPPGRGASPSHMALRACMHAVPGRGARAHLTWHREHATHACDPGRVMHALLAGGWEHASMCPCRWSARVPQGSCASYLYGVAGLPLLTTACCRAGRQFSPLIIAGGVALAASLGGLLLDDGVKLGEEAVESVSVRAACEAPHVHGA